MSELGSAAGSQRHGEPSARHCAELFNLAGISGCYPCYPLFVARSPLQCRGGGFQLVATAQESHPLTPHALRRLSTCSSLLE